MMKDNDIQSIRLICPHCNKSFNMEELFKHNNLNNIEFSSYIDKEINERLKKSVLVEKEKYVLELGKREAEIKNQVQEELLTLKNKLQQKESDLNQEKSAFNRQVQELQEKYVLELGKREAEIKNQVQEELLTLKNKLQQKESDLNQEKSAFNRQVQELQEKYVLELGKREAEIKNQVQEENERKVLSLTDRFNKQIQELKIKNAENRIINSKTKGENWELEVANELYKAFGYIDKIEKITIGEKRADYLQKVKNGGEVIGKIVYEVKNAKWSDSWIEKLSVDVARNKTKYGILVATSFQEKYHGDISFIQSDEHPNIWIADPWSFIFVAQVVRKLIEIEHVFLIKANSLSTQLDAEAKIKQLQEYLDYEMPGFIKTFNKQLEKISKVKKSIEQTSNKHAKSLDEVHDILQRKFEKLVQKRIEKIVGVKIIEQEEDEEEIRALEKMDFSNLETNVTAD